MFIARFRTELRARKLPFDVLSFEQPAAKLLAALAAHPRGVLVAVQVGVMDTDSAECKFLARKDVRDALSSFARAGGVVMLNGDRSAATALCSIFGLTWRMDGDYYRRATATLQTSCAAISEKAARKLPGELNAKACMLSNVPPQAQVYALPSGAKAQSHVRAPDFDGTPLQAGMCTVALASFGSGAVGFFGDVNSEEDTISAVVQLASSV